MEKLLAHGLLAGLCSIAVAAFAIPPAPAADPAAPDVAHPLESPGSTTECYEWKYPKNDACGTLSDTKECKSAPTIESSDDAAKKAACTPTKGDVCVCE